MKVSEPAKLIITAGEPGRHDRLPVTQVASELSTKIWMAFWVSSVAAAAASGVSDGSPLLLGGVGVGARRGAVAYSLLARKGLLPSGKGSWHTMFAHTMFAHTMVGRKMP